MFFYLRILFFIALFPLLTSFNSPLIVKKVVRKNTVKFTLPKEFYGKYIKKDYFIQYPKEVKVKKLPSSITDIPLIMNTIAMVWISGQDYFIEEMDEDLYHSLEKIKIFFKRWHSNTEWNGRLVPKRLVKNVPPITSSRPAMLFTCGVDSTTTLFRHWDENPYLILFLHKKKNNGQPIKDFAKDNGFSSYIIRSNFQEFLNKRSLHTLSCDITDWRLDAIEGLGWMGMAAPFLYAKGIPLLYIASTATWQTGLFKNGKTVRGIYNPIVDDNLSAANFVVKHDSFTLTREDKLEFIASFCQKNHFPKPHLIPCSTRGNCERCAKCLRTMNGLLALGEDPGEYGFTIPLDEIIKRSRFYFSTFSLTRPGAYYNYCTIQEKATERFETLPVEYQDYFRWFLSLNFWEKLKDPPRPEPKYPFSWELFRDLYPDIPKEEFEPYPH